MILVRGSREDAEALREDVAAMLAPLGLRLSEAKTRVVHMADGFDFLAFRIRWKRKRGTNEWYVYTFIADQPLKSLKARICALTHESIAVVPRIDSDPARSADAGMGQLLPARRRQMDIQQTGHLHLVETRPHAPGPARLELGPSPPPPTTATGRWVIAADGIEYFRIEGVTVSRYAYRGNKIPSPWPATNPA